jgi:beta-N-acetylhexosaminidase
MIGGKMVSFTTEMKRIAALLLSLWIILGTLVVSVFPAEVVFASQVKQTQTPADKAAAMLAIMTPEEKVGQLFLVTFNGWDVVPDSPIYELITRYHIGGVVLSQANDNFTGPENAITETYALTALLQTTEWQSAQEPMVDTSLSTFTPQYIPLFIGISQEGDQSPYDQIYSGVTAMPNLMSIGATWETKYAVQIGAVMGRELSALGFNFYLGPSLDVLDLQNLGGDDLGTRTFGGDPYWVGVMGKAYIQGLHEGSNNRMAVIAKHFPGRGSSDRQPEKEVATVRKSLEQLKQVELEPFFQVTGKATTESEMAEGLLVSHIRYQGFQGNIRANTRPVSFDPAALETILALEQFASWRTAGGVVVSDDIGSEAVRSYFDPTGQSFDMRQVARNAFLAGNDLLFVDNFLSAGDPDAITSARRTLDSFAQKYREDTAFAERVDEAVLRLLTLKYELYPTFDLEQVIPPNSGLEQVGGAQSIAFEVARTGVTLISPSAGELAAILGEPPQLGQRIVFITDVLSSQQCSRCVSQASLEVDTLESAVLRLYGPRGTGQVSPLYLSSYSFNILTALLDGDVERSSELADSLNRADWVVFVALDVQVDRPDSQALKRLLSERSDLLNGKKVIVFAFNAPYYLDATDISMISTAYYGIYSKVNGFADVAARILFQELSPLGSSPVSIPGTGYDLISATSPNPEQTISLMFDFPETPEVTATPTSPAGTPEVPVQPAFKMGDTIPFKTGVILDHNNHPVPDGTVVRFEINVGAADSGVIQQIETETVNGVAKAAYRIQSPGVYEFSVKSDPARNSDILRLEIIGNTPAAITEITPTATATFTPSPTPTNTPSPTLIVTPPPPVKTDFVDWSFAMLFIGAAVTGIFFAGRAIFSMRWGFRWGMTAAMGGLIAYLYLTLGLPGSEALLRTSGTPGVVLVCLLGIILGWAGGGGWLLWWMRKSKG